MASALVAHPSASLPQQLAEWCDRKAAYRLVDTTEVTPAALLEAHWEQTRAAARQAHVVLLVQDTTEVDCPAPAQTRGLGPMGTGAGAGILVQSVLAIEPTTRPVLGVAAQEPFLRQAAPRGVSCAQRRQREREAQVWRRAIAQVGGPPGGGCWVPVGDRQVGDRQVGDRYADLWGVFTTCAQQGCDFLVRAAQARRVQPPPPQGAGSQLFAALPHLAEWDAREVEGPAQHGRPKRTARRAISGGPLTWLPPRQPSGQQPVRRWVIWVRAIGAPPDGGDALEGVLLTWVPTADAAAAWERVAWYRCRWLVAE
jgi:hypothetical protein